MTKTGCRRLNRLKSSIKVRLKRTVNRLYCSPAKRTAASPSTKMPTFSIGIYSGNFSFFFEPHQKVTNPVLTSKDVSDVDTAFVADPFMIKIDCLWYMFFEVLKVKICCKRPYKACPLL